MTSNSAKRQAIIDAISDLSLGTFTVSSERPWDAAGQALYLKNFKTFYVTEADTEETTLYNVLNGSSGSMATKETTISAYVLVDAKQQPSNYDDLVDAVQDCKETADITGVRSRECDVITTFEADAMLTEFVFRFTELKIS